MAASDNPLASTYPSDNFFTAFSHDPRYLCKFSAMNLDSFFSWKIYTFDRPPTHLASSAPSDGRAFALLAAIEPFPGKIFHVPRHVASHVASS